MTEQNETDPSSSLSQARGEGVLISAGAKSAIFSIFLQKSPAF